MSQLSGKFGIVFGVANKRSIAWAIAQAWHQAGAPAGLHLPGRAAQGERRGTRRHLRRRYLPPALRRDPRRGYRRASSNGRREIRPSCTCCCIPWLSRPRTRWRANSSTPAARLSAWRTTSAPTRWWRWPAAPRPLMTEGGSIMAMSYYGAEKVVPHYNVMGVAKASLEACTRYLAYDLGPKKIRVNCISAGPVNTLAARGIAGFTEMLKHYEAHAPLKRNVLPGGTRRHRRLPGQRRRRGHHRPGDLRGLRLPDHGHVTSPPGPPAGARQKTVACAPQVLHSRAP